MAIVGGLTPALGFSAHLPENRGAVAHCRAALSIEQMGSRITEAIAFA
jgi:hypothetical protein